MTRKAAADGVRDLDSLETAQHALSTHLRYAQESLEREPKAFRSVARRVRVRQVAAGALGLGSLFVLATGLNGGGWWLTAYALLAMFVSHHYLRLDKAGGAPLGSSPLVTKDTHEAWRAWIGRPIE